MRRINGEEQAVIHAEQGRFTRVDSVEKRRRVRAVGVIVDALIRRDNRTGFVVARYSQVPVRVSRHERLTVAELLPRCR